jgi:hypothetical protein
MARTKSEKANSSAANLGFEANLRNSMDAAECKHVVLAPHKAYKGRIYNPSAVPGGMFVQSESPTVRRFIESHARDWNEIQPALAA